MSGGSTDKRGISPPILFVKILAIIFVAEFFVMVGLRLFGFIHGGVFEFLTDSTSLSIISAPFLYFWVVKAVERRLRAEAQTSREALGRELSAKAYAEKMAVRAYADNIVRSVPSALVSLTRDFGVRSVNSSFIRMFSMDYEPSGKGIEEVQPIAGLKEAAEEVLLTGFTKKDIVFKFNVRGVERFYSASITEVTPSEGEGERELLLVIEDVTEKKRSEEAIAYMAHYDQLTGLPNKQLLMDRLKQAVNLTKRQKKMAAVLYLDLDRFKFVNDTLGHAAGDELLKIVGGRLTSSIRPSDTAARLGGDEFVMVLPDMERLEDVVKLTRRIVSAFDVPVEVMGEEFRVTASMGVSMYPGDGEDPETLLKNADVAMYRAKEEGRNNCQFYEPAMNVKGMEWLKLVNKLRRAVDREEFVLYYQPQVNAATGKLIGVEALIRWQDPETGLLLPGSFIPAAEDTGLIAPIEEWVFRAACKQCKVWREKGLNPVRMAVNISMQHFRQKDFMDPLASILEKAVCRYPGCLELELTESVIMRNVEETIKLLHKLKEMGFSLAIDDFGTGYSCLAYLKTMPIDRLKIAQSFVRDITVDPNDAAIASAIVGVGHSLGIEVIAEGVETLEQLRMLEALGCTDVQGYLVSRPMPPDGIEAFLKKEWRFYAVAR